MRISVVIPTFDRRVPLRRALASVVAQTLPPLEVLVVDDGSRDGTLRDVVTRFPAVRLLRQPNRGVSAARNRGIRAARGDWIALLDSDDTWRRDKLARQAAALADEPDFMVCHSDEIWIRNGRRVNARRRHAKPHGWVFERSLALCLMSPSSILIRREVFEAVGLFDETLPACEDYDLWLRIAARYPVLLVPEPLIVKYGGHADQLSRRYVAPDRFRIQSLRRLLDERAHPLDARQAAAALQVLQDKTAVYAAGARKRGRVGEAAALERALRRLGRRWRAAA